MSCIKPEGYEGLTVQNQLRAMLRDTWFRDIRERDDVMDAQRPRAEVPLRSEYLTCVIKVELVGLSTSEISNYVEIQQGVERIEDTCLAPGLMRRPSGGYVPLGETAPLAHGLRLSVYSIDSQINLEDPEMVWDMEAARKKFTGYNVEPTNAMRNGQLDLVDSSRTWRMPIDRIAFAQQRHV
ncbi:MAG: hypothetical protein M1827_007264 [Pycnora praestabilis]|nr:MAG: hypothetical protein M1827_007264 [Pycnora praestabilis]